MFIVQYNVRIFNFPFFMLKLIHFPLKSGENKSVHLYYVVWITMSYNNYKDH